jgi:hypothetical protein
MMVTGSSMTDATRPRWFSFRLRTLLAVMTGCAFIAFVAQWILSQTGGIQTAILVIPWAIGSFAGIYLAVRRDRSILLWAVGGGTLGCLLCPGSLVVFLYANNMNGVNSLSILWHQLAFAAAGSWLLAAFVGTTRHGLFFWRKRG